MGARGGRGSPNFSIFFTTIILLFYITIYTWL